MPTGPGGLAQLGERQLCKLDVTGSIPVSSTSGKQHRAKFRVRFDGRRTRSGGCSRRWRASFLTIKEFEDDEQRNRRAARSRAPLPQDQGSE
jgi:hypothetical protein